MPCDEAFFAALTAIQRTNQFAMDARKAADLKLGALLRMQMGWSLRKPADERKAIAEHCADLMATGERLLAWELRMEKNAKSTARPPDGLADPLFQDWQQVIMSSLRGRLPMAQLEAITKAKMEAMAAQLPVADWWRANVFKDGMVSLARIIAETGDLSNYATVSKVWKRMCLAVFDGARQGRVNKTGKTPAAIKDEWIAQGYSPRRRAVMFVIGDSIEKSHGHYAQVCRAEKQRQIVKAAAEGLTVAPAASIPKKRAAEFRSEGHIRARALRYMEKQLLRDLWCAWNGRAILDLMPMSALPSRPFADAAHPEVA